MFLYIMEKDGFQVPYDDDFQEFATIKYVQSKSGTSGHLEPCNDADFKQFMSLPGLKGINTKNLYCPPIEFAEEI